MPFPTDTYLQFIRNGATWVAQEFEHLYAQVQGYLAIQHKDDGTHGDVTADSLSTERIELTRNPQDDTTRVLSFKNSTGDGLALSFDGTGLAISNETVTDVRTPVFTLGTVDPGAGVSPGTGYYLHATAGDNWAVIIGQDAYADFLGWYNDSFGSDAAMKLYKSTGGMRLCPPTGTSGTHTLGSPDSSSLRWDGVFTEQITIAGGTALSHYSEGTFTPVLAFGGGSTGITYSNQIGRYTRIGRQVTCTLNVLLTSKGSSTGAATIAGLPFTVGSAANWSTSGAAGYFASFSTITSLNGIATGNTTSVALTTNGAGGTSTVDNTHFTDTAGFLLTLTYFV